MPIYRSLGFPLITPYALLHYRQGLLKLAAYGLCEGYSETLRNTQFRRLWQHRQNHTCRILTVLNMVTFTDVQRVEQLTVIGVPYIAVVKRIVVLTRAIYVQYLVSPVFPNVVSAFLRQRLPFP